MRVDTDGNLCSYRGVVEIVDLQKFLDTRIVFQAEAISEQVQFLSDEPASQVVPVTG